jgi:hypothetical protein
MITSRSVLLRLRNVSDEEIKTHTSYANSFFTENSSVYAITWEDMVEPNRPQMTKWRLRVVCRQLRQETHTQNTYTYYFSTIATVARTQLNATSYEHYLSRYKYCKISVVKHNSCIFYCYVKMFLCFLNIIIKDTRVVFDGTDLTVFIARTHNGMATLTL